MPASAIDKKDKSSWPNGSAGSVMRHNVPVLPSNTTVTGTKAIISEHIHGYESIDYIYVVDKNHHLQSVLSIRELFRNPSGTRLKDIDPPHELITVFPNDQQEYAANEAMKHGVEAIPVIDDQGIFLGVITHTHITKIIQNELRGHILHLTGVHHSHKNIDNVFDLSIFQSIRHRIPWLIIGLFGGLIAAKIITLFEATLEQNIVLAAFIPLVVYIADAVGTQLEAFTIRDFALFRKLSFVRYLIRQLVIVGFIAGVIGSLLFLSSLAIGNSVSISLVLGLAVVSATLSSLISGLIVPFIFRSFKLDPANASGPIGTIIQDILTVAIYFLIADILLI